MRPHLVSWLEGVMPSSWAALLAPTWFTGVGLAGVISLFWMLRNARRAQLDPARVASVMLWSYLAAVIAGIAVPMLIDTATHLMTRGRLSVHWAGMTSFWGYLAGFVAVLWLTRRHALPLARFADVTAAPLGAALICSRLGCFLAGCDFGKVTSGPLAMRFPSKSPAWHDHVRAGLLPPGRDASLPVHPTQLYEALLGAVMIAVAIAVSRSAWGRARAGRAFLAVAATYGVGRIGVEVLRGDAGRGLWLGLSSGQLFSLALLGAVMTALLMQARRGRDEGDAGGKRGGASKLPRLAAAALVVLALGHGERAFAWPAPGVPGQAAAQPKPAAAPATTPGAGPGQAQPQQPYAETPISPYDAATDPAAQPPMGMQPSMQPPMQPQAEAQPRPGRPRFEAGVLLGWATSINRREGQVASLAGPTLSVGLALASGLGVWLDFDSLGNDDASHGTLAISGGLMRPLAKNLEIGARLGLGFTMVNFDEPVFRDVTATNIRFEALANYQLSERWQIWIRPLSIEALQSSQLGGPITTLQFRLGVAARFGQRHGERATSPQSPLPGQPQQYYYPPAGQQYPPAAQPYPPAGQQQYPPAAQPYPPGPPAGQQPDPPAPPRGGT